MNNDRLKWDNILEYRLNSNMFSDEYEYYFMFLSARFEGVAELWNDALEKQFNKKFKPIWIISAKMNELFKKENYIIINNNNNNNNNNNEFEELVQVLKFEDLNLLFSKSNFVLELIDKLKRKQEFVNIVSFMSSFLYFNDNKIRVLGPNPELATRFENKIEQFKLFESLNIFHNNYRLYASLESIDKCEKFPFFLYPIYGSGGEDCKIIYSKKDLNLFQVNLREINRANKFLVCDLITNILCSPNVNAFVVGENETKVVCISDQILRGNEYLGNIYPSIIIRSQQEEILKVVTKVGNYLSKLGFRGLFGIDFIVTSDQKLIAVDLNPRRQGGYACNVLMALPNINLIEMEIRAALGESLPEFDYDDFQVQYSWAHSKIKPYASYMRIMTHFKVGDMRGPFDYIGTNFKTIFYPANKVFVGGCLGFYLISGFNRDKLLIDLFTEIEKIISLYLNTYIVGHQ